MKVEIVFEKFPEVFVSARTSVPSTKIRIVEFSPVRFVFTTDVLKMNGGPTLKLFVVFAMLLDVSFA